MRKWYALFVVLLLSYLGGFAGSAQSQQSNTDTARKLVHKVEARYPDIARKMNLGGTVKVVATVAADGNVKKVEPVGGSPLLLQAAEMAVSQWKYAAGSESKEIVELHFTP
jgi:outer membrane biosynthesis protein TonB